MHGTQQGTAVLLAVLIVFIVASISVATLKSTHLDVQRTGLHQRYVQFLQQAYAMEAWGIEVLRHDALTTSTDHHRENWTSPIDTSGRENRSFKLSGRIIEQNGLINVNHIAPDGSIDPVMRASVKRVLMRDGQREELVDHIGDWLDNNTQRTEQGAESMEYAKEIPAYRSADAAMMDISEMVWLKDIKIDELEYIKPRFSVLPYTSRINVNMLTQDAIDAYFYYLPENIRKQIHRIQQDRIWKSEKEFIDDVNILMSQIAQDQVPHKKMSKVSVQSQYFILESLVRQSEDEMMMSSYVYRDRENNQLKVYQRKIRWLQ